MDDHRSSRWSRREFVGGLTVAGTAGLLGIRPQLAAAEPPPETTRIRLARLPAMCKAPQYLAEELLRAEGFSDVQYVSEPPIEQALAEGLVDISMNFTPDLLLNIDTGQPVVFLAGIHIGCYELFGTDQVRTIRDLKGKTVALYGFGAPTGLRTPRRVLGVGHLFVESMALYVGLDPAKDFNWLSHPEAKQLFTEGKVDAYLAFPVDAQELRAKKIGHVVVASNSDRPWSQHFCCSLAGNRDFVRTHPVATKRTMRAILKAADICAQDPARVARFLVDKDYVNRYDYALQAMKEIPYNKWREYDPEATVRFYALRLRDAGMIKANPQKIIAQGTDWRFLKELKRELKG